MELFQNRYNRLDIHPHFQVNVFWHICTIIWYLQQKKILRTYRNLYNSHHHTRKFLSVKLSAYNTRLLTVLTTIIQPSMWFWFVWLLYLHLPTHLLITTQVVILSVTCVRSEILQPIHYLIIHVLVFHSEWVSESVILA